MSVTVSLSASPSLITQLIAANLLPMFTAHAAFGEAYLKTGLSMLSPWGVTVLEPAPITEHRALRAVPG